MKEQKLRLECAFKLKVRVHGHGGGMFYFCKTIIMIFHFLIPGLYIVIMISL